MGIPDEILHKPGPLLEDEWALVKKHPQTAFDLLLPISSYHKADSPEQVLQYLREQSARLFDSQIVRVFAKIVKK